MALALLYKSAESIGATYEPSASAAMRELGQRSGVTVVVLAPYGGARTDAEGRAINPYLDPRLSDHNYRKGRALDVNNRGDVTSGLARREGITFAAAVTLYYKIWAKYGWRNIQINGDPFPTEPWHMATHSTTPAGSGGTPLPDQNDRKKGGKDMSILLFGPDTGTATAPGPKVFVVASPGVWDRYSASYSDKLGSQYGSAVELSLASMLAKREEYLNPIGYATIGDITIPPITIPPADNTAVLTKLDQLVAAVKSLNPPG